MPQIPYVERSAIAALRAPREVFGSFLGLYVEGSLEGLAAPTVAIVGTRAATLAGCRRAHTIAAGLSAAGVCVISGLALGIDGAAHQGALSVGAPTIAVLGGGHDHFFPKPHRDLARAMIAGGGAVASPYPAQWPARPGQFLARNAIVAALADAVVVIEAGARSGALNTAGWAADLHVPVFALPGDVDRPKSAGCLALIRDGATLIRDAADILEALRMPALAGAATPSESAAYPPLAASIVRVLAEGEASIETIAQRCALATPHMLAALTMLELQGVIEARGGAIYALRSHGAYARAPG